MKKRLTRVLPCCLAVAMLAGGCQSGTTSTNTAMEQVPARAVEAAAAPVKQSGPVYKGKVTGKSNKARLISLEMGKGNKARTITIKFDDNTTGLEHARKGHGVIIAYEKRGNDIYATSIKQKIAKLPTGTSKVSVNDVKDLIDREVDFELIDSRPGERYSAGHLPTAISIPVCEMKELVSLLPKDKDKLLVFYCGGPT